MPRRLWRQSSRKQVIVFLITYTSLADKHLEKNAIPFLMVYVGFTQSYGSLAIARIMISKQYQHTAVGGAYAIVGIAVETFAENG